MTSNGSGDLWFLQPEGADPANQQTPPPPAPQQTSHSPNPTNPFNKVSQSTRPQEGSAFSSPQPGYAQPPYPPQQGSHYPPPQGSPYPQQQGSPYPQQQSGPYPTQQQGTLYAQPQGSPYSQQPYPPQQNIYPPPGPFRPPQQGYPQQGSPYPQQGYPQQDYSQPQSQFSDPNSQTGGEASSFYGSGPPPTVQPGPGPGGVDQRGFFDSAMQMAGVQQPPPGPDGLERGWFSSSKNPLDPPPKMFRRPAPSHYAYIKFRPVSVLAVSNNLQDGFALLPPVTAPGDPHPFTSHDITEEDWHKFLKDFQKTAHLSASDRLFQNMANSFMKDKITSANVQKRMAENKLEPIGDYLMAWNHYFFHPRHMSVVLARGSHRFSGETDDYPPDMNHHTKKSSKEKKSHQKTRAADIPLVTAAEPYPRGSLIGGLLNPLHQAIHETSTAITRAPNDLLYGVRPGLSLQPSRALRDSDSDSDSSSDSDNFRSGHRRNARERRGERGARRDEKRAEREARKEERRRERDRKHGRVTETVVEVPAGKFRLVICYWDGQREEY